MKDEEIVELYFSRSEDAISETALKYGNYCSYISQNILHSKEDAEECVNDAYFAAWKTIPPQRPHNLKTFLGKLTRNISLKKQEKYQAAKRGGGPCGGFGTGQRAFRRHHGFAGGCAADKVPPAP